MERHKDRVLCRNPNQILRRNLAQFHSMKSYISQFSRYRTSIPLLMTKCQIMHCARVLFVFIRKVLNSLTLALKSNQQIWFPMDKGGFRWTNTAL